MTIPQKRQPAGRPTGGQFATQEHPESGVSLAGRQSVLDGWPASLRDPVVDVKLDPEGGETLTLTVGDDYISVWTDNESTGRLEADAIGFQDLDEETVEAAKDYACKIYGKVAPAIRAEADAAVQRSKARIITAATGTVHAGTGRVPRPAEAILETPLSPFEIGARLDEHGYVTGLAEFEMRELVGSSLDSHLVDLSDKLVGSPLLMDVSGGPIDVGPGGVIVMELRGQADEIIDGFDDEEREQFEAGLASRAGGTQ